MKTRFQTLFSLEVTHGYYGGACEDVGFVVPRDVARFMRGAGLVTRSLDGAFHVFYSATGDGAPTRSAAGRTVRMGLRVQSPFFANITEDFNPGADALHYRNGSASAAGSLEPPARLPHLEPELRREGVFALVEITIIPGFYDSAPVFTVAFQARRDTLRYYVVAKGLSNGEVDQLAVRDQDAGEPGHPDEVKFEKVLPEQLSDDEKSQMELLGRDGARVLLFKSLSAVTRQQSGGKRLQLMRNSEPLIESLPQPGRSRGTAELIVQLSKSKA